MSFQYWAVRRWTHSSGCDLRSAKERGRIAPLHLCSCQCSPRCIWTSLLQGHTAGTHLTSCPPTPQELLFLQSCFLPSHPLACPVAWDCSFLPRCASFHLLLLNFRGSSSQTIFLACQCPPEDGLFPPAHHHSLRFGSISKHAESALYSIIQVVNKEIKP